MDGESVDAATRREVAGRTRNVPRTTHPSSSGLQYIMVIFYIIRLMNNERENRGDAAAANTTAFESVVKRPATKHVAPYFGHYWRGRREPLAAFTSPSSPCLEIARLRSNVSFCLYDRWSRFNDFSRRTSSTVTGVGHANGQIWRYYPLLHRCAYSVPCTYRQK